MTKINKGILRASESLIYRLVATQNGVGFPRKGRPMIVHVSVWDSKQHCPMIEGLASRHCKKQAMIKGIRIRIIGNATKKALQIGTGRQTADLSNSKKALECSDILKNRKFDVTAV